MGESKIGCSSYISLSSARVSDVLDGDAEVAFVDRTSGTCSTTPGALDLDPPQTTHHDFGDVIPATTSAVAGIRAVAFAINAACFGFGVPLMLAYRHGCGD